MIAENFEEEDDSSQLTPPELVEKYKDALVELLPPKSKEKYDRVYKDFLAWRESYGGESFSERVVLAFLMEKKRNVAPSTLWAISSMLKATLLSYQNINIGNYPKIVPYLKRNSVGFQPKKAKVFTHEEVDKFLMEAPDDSFLMKKVFNFFIEL